MRVSVNDDDLEEWYKLLSKKPLDEGTVDYVRLMMYSYIETTYESKEVCAELFGDMA